MVMKMRVNFVPTRHFLGVSHVESLKAWAYLLCSTLTSSKRFDFLIEFIVLLVLALYCSLHRINLQVTIRAPTLCLQPLPLMLSSYMGLSVG